VNTSHQPQPDKARPWVWIGIFVIAVLTWWLFLAVFLAPLLDFGIHLAYGLGIRPN
jgi:hypothetical protein